MTISRRLPSPMSHHDVGKRQRPLQSFPATQQSIYPYILDAATMILLLPLLLGENIGSHTNIECFTWRCIEKYFEGCVSF